MTEGPQVGFFKEDENCGNGDHKQLQRLWERLHKYCKGRKCDNKHGGTENPNRGNKNGIDQDGVQQCQ